jgi:glycosyltransferase involved in cell wall biosynthesis
MRILLLTPDAFGGHGGIAQYNRDLLTALSAISDVEEIVAVPRFAPLHVGTLPPKLTHHVEGLGGKIRYTWAVFKVLRRRFDLVICGHINLLSLAWLASVRARVPLVLLVYGIDVWQPHKSILTRMLLRRVDAVWSISEITRDKMIAWSKLSNERFHILPNAIDLDYYAMVPKDAALVARYGLSGRKVMMILARLVGCERYKGVDELLELLPDLLTRETELVFLVAGDGNDRARLEEKAKALGVADRVVFTGYVSETEKAAHFRLADAFVMPGRCEGFGFVFLEAMACGVPVVASTLDGSREAVRFGQLGQMVNPDDRTALSAAIIRALNAEKGIPKGLEYFSFANFQCRLQAMVLAATSK